MDSSNPSSTVGEIGLAEIESQSMFLHVGIFLSEDRLFGPSEFRLQSFTGNEEISQPFEFNLELRGNSELVGEPVNFNDFLGSPITIAVNEPSAQGFNANKEFLDLLAGAPNRGFLSVLNGVVASVQLAEPGVYRMTMRPALWMLSLTNRYVVHRQKSILGAISSILSEHNINFEIKNITNDNPGHSRTQDWLQAGETDLEFVNRLLSKLQLYYYFEHSASSHKLVISNADEYPKIYVTDKKLRYTHTTEQELGLEQDDLVTQYSYEESLTASSISSVFSVPEVASGEDEVAAYKSYENVADTPKLGERPFNLYRIYPFGGSKGEVDAHTIEQKQMLDTSKNRFSGQSNCPRIHVGYQFSLTNMDPSGIQPEKDVRPNLNNQTFVATSVKHEANLDGSYKNTFSSTGLSVGTLVSPFDIHNTHQGSMLAEVVAHNEVDQKPADWRYYEQKNFDPIVATYKDNNIEPATQEFQGVYVFFSNQAAGSEPVWVRLAPHMQTAPEIGSMVIVARSNDYGELPEIQSIVQNNGTIVITPSKWTANTHIGSSYSTNYGDSKSIRFKYDHRASDLPPAIAKVEQRYNKGTELGSKKFQTSGVFRDVSYSKGGAYGYSTATKGRGDMLNESVSIGCTYANALGEETKSWSDFDLAWSSSQHKNVKSYQKITQKQQSVSDIGDSVSKAKYTGKVLSKTTHEGRVTTKSINEIGSPVSSENTYKDTVKSEATHHAPVKSKQTYHAGATMTSSTSHNAKVSSDTTYNAKVSSTTNHNANVDSDTNILGVQSSTSNIAVQTSSSKVGVSNSNSLTGVNNSNSIVGLHNSNSLVKRAIDINITALKAGLGVTALDASVNMTLLDFSIQISLAGSPVRISPSDIETKLPGLESKILVGLKSIL